MPFSNLNTAWSDLAQYYNSVNNNGVFTGTSNNPNVTYTSKFKSPKTQYTSFDDGLIRGGALNAGLASARDADRVGKFFLTGKGALFIAKQVGLQKSNVLPELAPGEIGGFAFIDKAPTRTYNLGVNTLTQVPLNAFGGHIIRHGIVSAGGVGFLKGSSIAIDSNSGLVTSDTPLYSYEQVVLQNNKDQGAKIELIYNRVLNDPKANTNRLVKYLSIISNNPVGTQTLFSYNGGADSVYGIGKTFINTSNIRTTAPFGTYTGKFNLKLLLSLNQAELQRGSLKNQLLGIFPVTEVKDPTGKPSSFQLSGVGINTSYQLATQYDNIKYQADNNIELKYGISRPRNGKKSNQKLDTINTINVLGSDVFYNGTSKNITDFLANKPVSNNTYKTPYNDFSSSLDGTQIKNGVEGDSTFGKDIIKFRIEFLNNDTQTPGTGLSNVNTDVLAFRAYINDFSDGMNAKWNSYRYMGRGEEFFIYEGFTRDISVDFTIFTHSPSEMPPIYQKLNYLMSSFTPDYNDVNKMRGNIAYLTIGDYLYRQPGVFTDIKLSGMLDSHWEIGLDSYISNNKVYNYFELPKHIKVNLSFKPIHTFLPRKVRDGFKPTFITPDPNYNITNNYI